MNNLRELNLKSSYDSDVDDILFDFYLPALSVASKYSRLSGYFCSSSLAVAAKGISGLLNNKGQIRLVTGAKFSKQDIDAIKKAYQKPNELLEKKFLDDLKNIESVFVRDHINALAWMVANKKLEIKIAIVNDSTGTPLSYEQSLSKGIFHQKVGILEDSEGNKISFSGSDNETANGWKNNIEEFKVFRNWVENENQYFSTDFAKFEKFWSGQAKRTSVIDLPFAIKEKLLEIAPADRVSIDLNKWTRKKNPYITFREYQTKAINNWLNNNKNGIFEMATGTGKTITALGCLTESVNSCEKQIIIISSPFIHLSKQWKENVEKFGIKWKSFFADSSQTDWKNKLADNIFDIENGVDNILLVLTTHNTLSSNDFIQIIQKSKQRVKSIQYYLIVDEVHGIGSPERKKGLIPEYDYRLGLSATPTRWYDFEGTEDIFNYFGKVVFEFSLDAAIKSGYLTKYEYIPHFVKLTQEELNEYKQETKKIITSYYASKDDKEKNKIFALLCIKRAKIIRNAMNKMIIFEKILDSLGNFRNCLVYCSPQQIRTVQSILNQRNIIQHKFTQQEGIKPEQRYGWLSERKFLIKRFADGFYHALVSMRCLDEGVDVPPAQIGIMLANSGNPKEYIQRRGRLLRKYPQKEKAIIHDVIVEPPLFNKKKSEISNIERKIFLKELERYKEFARSATNSKECLQKITELESKYGSDEL